MEDLKITRRNFLKASGALGTALALGGTSSGLFKQTVPAAEAAPAAAESKDFFACCPSYALCTAVCPVKVTVSEGRITHITNQPDSTCCAKGHSLRMTVYNPTRMGVPLKRVGERGEGKWQRITWDEAIDLYASKIKEIGGKYGNEAILFYPSRGTGGMTNSAPKTLFSNVLGGMVRTWGSLCIGNKGAAAPTVYGTGSTESDLDTIKDSKLAIIWGYGFADSNRRGDFAGEGMRIVMDAKEKGTRIVVIDPFFSQTAAKADQWIPIMPGTDGAMALAMANVIINKNLYDKDFVAKFVLGFDEFKQHVQQYTPEWAAKITGVSADVITNLATEFATKQPSALFPGDGPSRVGLDPSQWVRACGAVAALVGSVGKPGTNATSGQAYAKGFGIGNLGAAEKSKVKVQINECRIGDAILTGKALQSDYKTVADTPIRLLIGHGASVINQAGDSNKIVKALKKLDYIICADQFLTPFANYSDLFLPVTTGFEHYDAGYYGSSGHALVYSEKAIEPMYECKSDYEIWGLVANKLGVGADYHSDWKDLDWMRETIKASAAATPGLADLTLERLQKEKVIMLGPRPYIPFQDQVKGTKPFPTKSGKIEFISADLKAQGLPELPTYIDDFENPRHPLAKKYPLAICTPHLIAWLHSRSNNPWINEMYPIEVIINPADASARSIKNGDTVLVLNDRGTIQRKANVSERVPTGVVALPQGSWYNVGPDGVDRGSCVNTLTVDTIDRLGGSGTYNSALVEVKKA